MRAKDWIDAEEAKLKAELAAIGNSGKRDDVLMAAFGIAASVPFHACINRQIVAYYPGTRGDLDAIIAAAAAAIVNMIDNAVRHMTVCDIPEAAASSSIPWRGNIRASRPRRGPSSSV